MAKPNKKSDQLVSEDEMMLDHEYSDMCYGGGMYCDGGHRWTKKIVAVTASALFLVITIFVGMQVWGNPWYKNIRAEFTSTPYAKTITVEGEGKITVKPDIAKVSLSVASAGKTVAEVTADNNTKMNAVINQLKLLGIKAADIQTTAYSLYPQYDYGNPVMDRGGYVPTKPVTPKILGYNLNQTVLVKIRDLAKADQVLDKGIAAGANEVGSLTFDLDDASNVKKEARTMAFQKAREKAQDMATAAGVSLGNVITFSENTYGGGMPYANFAMKAMDSVVESAPSPAIEPGSQEFTINVSVTYEIN